MQDSSLPDRYRNWRVTMLTAAFLGSGLFLVSILLSFLAIIA